MGNKKGPELPPPPSYQTDPIFDQGYKSLFDYGSQLSKGDFSGNLSWLSPTINNNNSALALAAAQGQLQPQFRDNIQQITNEAAKNGNMSSSTFTDALAKAASDVNSQYQTIVSQQAINDSNKSNENRLSLFGTGLNSMQSASQMGFGNQQSKNQFNLANYDNQVAKSLQDHQNSLNPGFFGNMLSTFSPLAHDIYSAQGYNVPGMGSQQALLTAGSMFAGGGQGGLLGNSLQTPPQASSRLGFSAPGAGAFASNAPFTASPWNPTGARNYFQ